MTARMYSDAHVREIAVNLSELEGPLLPILHAIQAQFGHIPEDAVPVVAEVLNLTRAEVHGVVTFYHDFRREPDARKTLKLCGAEACQSMGVRALKAEAEKLAGPDVAVETVYCLGLCATAPAAMLDGKVYGRLDKNKLVDLIGAGT